VPMPSCTGYNIFVLHYTGCVRRKEILGDHSIGRSKQEGVYVHVSNSERFPR
jgi:hypothetical protein